MLMQSGLDEKWWADSMECYTYLRNIQDLLDDGETPHEQRFGEPSKARLFRLVLWLNIILFLRRTCQGSTNFGKKVLAGTFLGYVLIAGGAIWKGDILVADIEELENLDASEIHARRLSATPKNGELFIFPIADGTVKVSGGDQVFRKSTLIRDQPGRGEELRDGRRGESDGTQPMDTIKDDDEVRNDFGSIEGNLH